MTSQQVILLIFLAIGLFIIFKLVTAPVTEQKEKKVFGIVTPDGLPMTSGKEEVVDTIQDSEMAAKLENIYTQKQTLEIKVRALDLDRDHFWLEMHKKYGQKNFRYNEHEKVFEVMRPKNN